MSQTQLSDDDEGLLSTFDPKSAVVVFGDRLVTSFDDGAFLTIDRNDDVMDLLMEDSIAQEKEVPKTEKLKELSEMLTLMLKFEKDIEEQQKKLIAAQEEYEKMNALLIPDLFDELGLKKITLEDGRTVEVKLKYTASISQENADNCFEWLKDNGHEAIIKHEVKVDIKKGETEEYEKVIGVLDMVGVSYKDKNFVHPQTLCSFVKEQVESGADFPKELFKVYPLRSTKVK